MVLLIFSLLSCTSYPKYDSRPPLECDLPDAPSDKVYFRGVQTETSGNSNAYKEFRLKNSGPWTRYEIGDNSPLEACTQYWLDRAPAKTTTTTTKPSTKTKTPPKYSSSDPEYQLAAIDKGTQYPSDSVIGPYANALSRLSKKCNERPISLGDMAVTAQELLEDKGRRLSLLEILNNVNNFIPNGSTAKSNCIEVFTALVVLD